MLLIVSSCSSTTESSTTQTTQPSDGTTSSTSTTSTTSSDEPLPIAIYTAWDPRTTWSGATSVDHASTLIGKTIAEACRVSFKYSFVSADAEQEFNLKIADNQWEDVIFMGKYDVWLDKLIENDVVMPLDEHFNMPDKYPNLAKIPEEVLKFFTHTDGHIYYFPGGWWDDSTKADKLVWLTDGWYTATNLLEKAGVSADELKTIEGIESALLKIKNANLKTDDGKDIIPLGSASNLGLWKVFFSTFGVTTANSRFGFDVYDNKLVHYRDHPQSKEALKFMNKLNNDGVMDPEWMTIQNDSLKEKLLANRIAVYVGQAWPFWETVTGGDNVVTDTLKNMQVPEVTGVVKVGLRWTYSDLGGSGMLIKKGAKEEDIDRLVGFANWCEETGSYRSWEMLLGTRGTIWDWSESRGGEPEYEFLNRDVFDIASQAQYSQFDIIGIHVHYDFPNADAGCSDLYSDSSLVGLKWIIDMNKFHIDAPDQFQMVSRALPMDAIVMPTDGDWVANSQILADIDTEFFAKLVGAKSDSEFEDIWTKYRSELEEKGKWTQARSEYENLYSQLPK